MIGGDARLRQRNIAGAEPLGGAQRRPPRARCRRAGIHPRLVIARRQQRAEQVERGVLGVLGHRIVAPGLAHQPLGIGAVAARRASPWPARTGPWPTAAIRSRTTTTRRRRRDGRPTARLRCAGAGRSATASSDWPRGRRDSARPRRRCRRCAGSSIRRACARPDRRSPLQPASRPPACACAPVR